MDAHQREMEALRKELGLSSKSVTTPINETVEVDLDDLVSKETQEKLRIAHEQGKQTLVKAISLGKRSTEQAKVVATRVKNIDFKANLKKVTVPKIKISRVHIKRIAFILLGTGCLFAIGCFGVALIKGNTATSTIEPIEVPVRSQVITNEKSPTSIVPSIKREVVQEQDLVEQHNDQPVDIPVPQLSEDTSKKVEASPSMEVKPTSVVEEVQPEIVKKTPTVKKKADVPNKKVKEQSWQDKANDDVERFLQQQQ